MIRLLLVLLGTITTGGPRAVAARPGGGPAGPGEPAGPEGPETRPGRDGRRGGRGGGGGRRRRVPRWLKVSAVAAVAVLVFRRALASVTLTALATVLHVVGIGAHLPRVSFAWPWQEVSTGTTATTDLGPWVLQKIEGISRPALGQATFDFVFTRKVSKNIGPLPCWYSSTFYAVGHASATVDLNPGPAWWAPSTGHFRLRVLSPPAGGKPGQVTVTMILPRPQLPPSADDVTIDDLPSRPLSTDHSWTYPGLACGAVLRPQFPESVLYAQAQRMAFYRAGHVPAITQPLIASAETEAAQTIRDSFIQPTVNALGYRLAGFTLGWAPAG
jgi:hypothetical protein